MTMPDPQIIQLLLSGLVSLSIAVVPLVIVWIRSRRKDTAETEEIKAKVASIWSDTYQEIIDNLRKDVERLRTEVGELNTELAKTRIVSARRLRIIQGLLEYLKDLEHALGMEAKDVRERVATRTKKTLPVDLDDEENL